MKTLVLWFRSLPLSASTPLQHRRYQMDLLAVRAVTGSWSYLGTLLTLQRRACTSNGLQSVIVIFHSLFPHSTHFRDIRINTSLSSFCFLTISTFPPLPLVATTQIIYWRLGGSHLHHVCFAIWRCRSSSQCQLRRVSISMYCYRLSKRCFHVSIRFSQAC